MSDRDNRFNRVFPELRFFSDRQEFKKAHSAATWHLLRSWRFWIYLIAYAAISIAILLPVVSKLNEYLSLSYGLRGGIIGGIIGGVFTIALQWFWRPPIRRYLRSQLQRQGIPICLQCGYDLRGQLTPRCPECATAFDEDLVVVQAEENEQNHRRHGPLHRKRDGLTWPDTESEMSRFKDSMRPPWILRD